MTGSHPSRPPRTCPRQRPPARPRRALSLPSEPEAFADWPATMAEHLAATAPGSLCVVGLAWMLDAATDPALSVAEVASTVRAHAEAFLAEWNRRATVPGDMLDPDPEPAARPARVLDATALATLPLGSVVLDCVGQAWQSAPGRNGVTWWWPASTDSDDAACRAAMLAPLRPVLLHRAAR